MNTKERDQLKRMTAKIMLALGVMLAIVACMAAFGGCYANSTFGHVEFPLTLLPDEQKTEDVRETIKADPTTMVTLQFHSNERVVGGGTIQDSKKDVQFDLDMPGFMSIKASGSRSVERVDVDAAPIIEATGGALGALVNEAVGVTP